jgi:hypothetical protein
MITTAAKILSSNWFACSCFCYKLKKLIFYYIVINDNKLIST